MPPGIYTLGGQQVELEPRAASPAAPGAPHLAGSALSMAARSADRSVHRADARGGPADGDDPPAEYIGIQPAGSVNAEWDAEAAALRIAGIA